MSVDTIKETVIEVAKSASFLNPIWTILLGVAAIVILFEIWVKNTREYRVTQNIPCPPRIPVLGNAHLVARLTNAGEFVIKRVSMYFFLLLFSTFTKLVNLKGHFKWFWNLK